MVSSSSPTSGAPRLTKRYELLTLGDELLLGLTANGHLTFIGAQLGRRGVLLGRNVTITDEAEEIARQFRESWAQADVIITTGGLGPTCDDRTREVIAEVLGQKLVFDPAIEQAIIDRFNKFGRKMTPNNLKQAYKFERGEVLPNANGTAPGLWVEQDGKVLCMLPGPPNELQPMFTEQVLPRLARSGWPRPRGLRADPHGRHRRVGAGDQAAAGLRPAWRRAERGVLRAPGAGGLPAEFAERTAVAGRARRDRGSARGCSARIS
jgi:nicotinamide-nucleotide amidase